MRSSSLQTTLSTSHKQAAAATTEFASSDFKTARSFVRQIADIVAKKSRKRDNIKQINTKCV